MFSNAQPKAESHCVRKQQEVTHRSAQEKPESATIILGGKNKWTYEK